MTPGTCTQCGGPTGIATTTVCPGCALGIIGGVITGTVGGRNSERNVALDVIGEKLAAREFAHPPRPPFKVGDRVVCNALGCAAEAMAAQSYAAPDLCAEHFYQTAVTRKPLSPPVPPAGGEGSNRRPVMCESSGCGSLAYYPMEKTLTPRWCGMHVDAGEHAPTPPPAPAGEWTGDDRREAERLASLNPLTSKTKELVWATANVVRQFATARYEKDLGELHSLRLAATAVTADRAAQGARHGAEVASLDRRWRMAVEFNEQNSAALHAKIEWLNEQATRAAATDPPADPEGSELKGSSTCPLCGVDTPHRHDDATLRSRLINEVAFSRTIASENFKLKEAAARHEADVARLMDQLTHENLARIKAETDLANLRESVDLPESVDVVDEDDESALLDALEYSKRLEKEIAQAAARHAGEVADLREHVDSLTIERDDALSARDAAVAFLTQLQSAVNELAGPCGLDIPSGSSQLEVPMRAIQEMAALRGHRDAAVAEVARLNGEVAQRDGMIGRLDRLLATAVVDSNHWRAESARAEANVSELIRTCDAEHPHTAEVTRLRAECTRLDQLARAAQHGGDCNDSNLRGVIAERDAEVHALTAALSLSRAHARDLEGRLAHYRDGAKRTELDTTEASGTGGES